MLAKSAGSQTDCGISSALNIPSALVPEQSGIGIRKKRSATEQPEAG